MSKPEKYNLQRLLEMRGRTRDETAIHLAECRRLLTAAENQLSERKQAVEDCRDGQRETQNQLIENSKSGMKSSEIVRYRQHLTDLREREIQLLAAVEEQRKAVERHAQTVEKALGALQEAARETKVIEKHRENWASVKRTETARREQKTNDEIGAILHERNKFDA